jgi:hypothetical protein
MYCKEPTYVGRYRFLEHGEGLLTMIPTPTPLFGFADIPDFSPHHLASVLATDPHSG